MARTCRWLDRQLFTAATTLIVGNGHSISFWNDAWVQGLRLRDIAPRLFTISKGKNKTLSEALSDSCWIRDLSLISVEFFGSEHSDFVWIIWKVWSPPKCKFFSWLAIQNRHIWGDIKAWTGVEGLNPATWGIHDSVFQWWRTLALARCSSNKGLRSLFILVNWTVWWKRNARVFYHNQSTYEQIISDIKGVARVWSLAGTKNLAKILP
ncbi:hypothetical protein PVAP13_5KG251207 [Panicum virgatum]|uniref:Reverse transcriptase zinc-binding domain-containing protein n=1 Tax=Panicum virgatum TaxID=38727 RepID=A0A8T0SGS3_PANVG|nr:hypothetical protein PVAP13_5KG251207 [Panicum virgatum]